MSGLEPLVPLIYHEKQQPGSQLCAQHALNVILQGDFFSAPDLAQFAQQLDALEGSFNDDAGSVSNNMDDTGFFSVQVLERALKIWGFMLVRWRSQELRHQQETPHAQMAFLLNHQQHWFSLRRFGSLEDPDNGHWFNLNSFLENPEWVGRLYLGMVLSQAEDEGYSVFAVLPTRETPDGPTTLPRTEADEVASTLPQPTSSNIGEYLSTTRVPPMSTSGSAQASGFEGEDLELQAALQASLMGKQGEIQHAALAELPRSSSASYPSSNTHLPTPSHDPEFSDELHAQVSDPVVASMARNKAIMQRMLREQEMALRDGYEEEVASRFGDSNGAEMGESSRNPLIQARSTGQVEEEEAIRRAIEESQRDGSHGKEESMDISDDNYVPTGASVSGSDDDDEPHVPHRMLARPMPPAFSGLGDRVYDDEDSELQAALKASLEAIPEGFHIPSTDPSTVPADVRPVSRSSAHSAGPIPAEEDRKEQEEEDHAKPAEEMDANELRRRRLARFGGQS